MTTRAATGELPIPGSHLDLLTRPLHGVLTTIGRDGQPQSSLVWVDADDDVAIINTTLERQKGRNMLANRKVNLLVVDSENTSRYIQIRGDAELTTEGALDHIDAITRPPSRVLRVRLPGRAACAGNEGHLPHPRSTDHPRRDPSPGDVTQPRRTRATCLRHGHEASATGRAGSTLCPPGPIAINSA